LKRTISLVCRKLTYKKEQDDVGDEEDGAAVLVGQVGKPPHVTDANLREEKGFFPTRNKL